MKRDSCFPSLVAQAIARLPVGTRAVVASFPLPESVTLEGDGDGLSNHLSLARKLILPTTFSHGEPFYFYDVV